MLEENDQYSDEEEIIRHTNEIINIKNYQELDLNVNAREKVGSFKAIKENEELNK